MEYLRSQVLVPLSHRQDQPFEGSRRLEDKLSSDIRDLLAATVPANHTASGYRAALDQIMQAYAQLFAALPKHIAGAVRQVDRDYFAQAIHGQWHRQ